MKKIVLILSITCCSCSNKENEANRIKMANLNENAKRVAFYDEQLKVYTAKAKEYRDSSWQNLEAATQLQSRSNNLMQLIQVYASAQMTNEYNETADEFNALLVPKKNYIKRHYYFDSAAKSLVAPTFPDTLKID